jgi:hypothetical protein
MLFSLLALPSFAAVPSNNLSIENVTPHSLTVYLTPTLGMAAVSLRSENGATGNDLGVSGGALLDIGTPTISFETGLLYNQLGGKSGDTQINLSYVGVPLLAKWNTTGRVEGVYLKGGVLPQILVSQNVKTQNEPTISGNDVGASSVDFGLLFGVGGTIPLSPQTALVLDVSYLRGLKNVVEKADAPIRNEGFIFSSGVSITL